MHDLEERESTLSEAFNDLHKIEYSEYEEDKSHEISEKKRRVKNHVELIKERCGVITSQIQAIISWGEEKKALKVEIKRIQEEFNILAKNCSESDELGTPNKKRANKLMSQLSAAQEQLKRDSEEINSLAPKCTALLHQVEKLQNKFSNLIAKYTQVCILQFSRFFVFFFLAQSVWLTKASLLTFLHEYFNRLNTIQFVLLSVIKRKICANIVLSTFFLV